MVAEGWFRTRGAEECTNMSMKTMPMNLLSILMASLLLLSCPPTARGHQARESEARVLVAPSRVSDELDRSAAVIIGLHLDAAGYPVYEESAALRAHHRSVDRLAAAGVGDFDASRIPVDLVVIVEAEPRIETRTSYDITLFDCSIDLRVTLSLGRDGALLASETTSAVAVGRTLESTLDGALEDAAETIVPRLRGHMATTWAALQGGELGVMVTCDQPDSRARERIRELELLDSAELVDGTSSSHLVVLAAPDLAISDLFPGARVLHRRPGWLVVTGATGVGGTPPPWLAWLWLLPASVVVVLPLWALVRSRGGGPS